VYGRGLLYGDAVFETVRFYDGEPFLWERHRRRLAASLAHFAIPAATGDLHGDALRVLARNRLRDAAVPIPVSGGDCEGLPEGRRGGARRGASHSRCPPRPVAGIRAALPFGRGTGGLTRGHKTTEYLAAVSGRLYAERRADDAISSIRRRGQRCVSQYLRE
jgi:branched-subunit amino acid aminotransferase/4-amino-4-deoxychorismate lyase